MFTSFVRTCVFWYLLLQTSSLFCLLIFYCNTSCNPIPQQSSFSISHPLDPLSTWWLDSDSVVTVVKCRQHSDYSAIGSSVSSLPSVYDINGDYTVTVQSLFSHCLVGYWWNRNLLFRTVSVFNSLIKNKQLWDKSKVYATRTQSCD